MKKKREDGWQLRAYSLERERNKLERDKKELIDENQRLAERIHRANAEFQHLKSTAFTVQHSTWHENQKLKKRVSAAEQELQLVYELKQLPPPGAA